MSSSVSSSCEIHRVITLRRFVQLLSAEQHFVQLLHALLPIFLFHRRALEGEQFAPRARIGLRLQFRLLVLQLLAYDDLHELRRRLPLLLVGHVAILQRLRLNDSLQASIGDSRRERVRVYQGVQGFDVPLMSRAAGVHEVHFQLVGDGIVRAALLLALD